MLTIGYSTRTSNPSYKDYLQKTCTHKQVQIIEKVNNGEKSLSEVYNEILSESENDIVVLCHDDLEFDTKNWGDKVLRIFERNSNFGIIGLAGTIFLPKSGMWWEDKTKMFGIVNHKHDGKKWESKYSESLDEKLKRVVLVDGLFICINKNKISENFDTSVGGFHMYDVNFCFKNFIKGVNIGVTTMIRVTHLSIGVTNEKWEENRKIFSEKYSSYLPSKVIYTHDDNLKILIVSNSLSNLNKELNKICSVIPNNFTKHILSNNVEKSYKKFLNKKNFLIFNENSIPGIKIGDGKWSLNINNLVQPSVVNKLYNLGNITYDLIISDSPTILDRIKTIFPNTNKILFSDKKFSLHNSIRVFNDLPNSNTLDFLIENINLDYNISNKIKIISGYSNKGGSTTAFVNLTNFLNDNGYNCTFFGPNLWHLDKCKSDLTENLKIESDDILIFHFINLPSRPNVKKTIFVCHEKWWWSFKNVNKFFDVCVFLHKEHRNYHSDYQGEFVIIPNLKEKLLPIEKSNLDKVAGVIGSIEERKQTHVSITRAISDGCEKVFLFGEITDKNYFENFVRPLLKDDKIILVGYSTDKQQIYNSIGRVYHSSKGEVACLVKDECFLTNTKFFGNEETSNEINLLSNNEILNLWKQIL